MDTVKRILSILGKIFKAENIAMALLFFVIVITTLSILFPVSSTP